VGEREEIFFSGEVEEKERIGELEVKGRERGG